MQLNDLLKLHQQYMSAYDKLQSKLDTPKIKSNIEQERINVLRIRLEAFVEITVLPIVLDDAKSWLDIDDSSRMPLVCIEAFSRTIKYLDESTALISENDYKAKFKDAYESALMLEMYKHFFAHQQNIHSLTRACHKHLIDIGKGVHSQESTPKEIIDFLTKDTPEHINREFAKLKAAIPNLTTDEIAKIKQMQAELEDHLGLFKSKMGRLFSDNQIKPTAEQIILAQKIALEFEIKAGKTLRTHQLSAESNQSWRPFIVNMLLLISVIGTIAAIISFLHKAKYGQYFFFDNPVLCKSEPNKIDLMTDNLIQMAGV